MKLPALAGVKLVVDPALPPDTLVARAGDRLYLGKVTPEGVRVVELPPRFDDWLVPRFEPIPFKPSSR